jgi:hypothetical protein
LRHPRNGFFLPPREDRHDHHFEQRLDMADESDPIKTLTAARDRMVQERRGLAVAIALGYRRRRSDDPHTNETREAFIAVQNLIEAIDRAIACEKATISRQPPADVVAELEAVS